MVDHLQHYREKGLWDAVTNGFSPSPSTSHQYHVLLSNIPPSPPPATWSHEHDLNCKCLFIRSGGRMPRA